MKLGARIVPFAGYEMPVQYPTGIIAEHNWTRKPAGLFDVSHMGQAFIVGADHRRPPPRRWRSWFPATSWALASGRIRYTQLTNAEGGIIDDLMIDPPRLDDDDGRLYLVVNASRKDVDYAWLEQHLPDGVQLAARRDRALVACRGRRRRTSWRAIAPRRRRLPS